jgi:hypothetical protein
VKTPNPREVIAVAGLASKSANLASFNHIAREIAGDGSVSHVDGGFVLNGKITASGPSRQAAEIKKIIETHPENEFIIISQSLGALGLLAALEENRFANMRGIAISPPLPSPSEIIRHPHLTDRMSIENGQLTIPSFSYAPQSIASLDKPEGKVHVHIPIDLFDEIDGRSKEYEARTRDVLFQNKLHIIMPTEDWNRALRVASADMPNIVSLPGPHSLFTDKETLRKNAKAIAHLVKPS